jgi:hypothetical protein
MKVKELIEELLKLDPELDVAIGYDSCMVTEVNELEVTALMDSSEYDPQLKPTTVILWNYKPNYD